MECQKIKKLINSYIDQTLEIAQFVEKSIQN
jgi:hypothetical protein